MIARGLRTVLQVGRGPPMLPSHLTVPRRRCCRTSRDRSRDRKSSTPARCTGGEQSRAQSHGSDGLRTTGTWSCKPLPEAAYLESCKSRTRHVSQDSRGLSAHKVNRPAFSSALQTSAVVQATRQCLHPVWLPV